MIKTILSVIVLLCAIPLGYFLASMTRDEKNIYSKKPYFPVFLLVVGILSVIFYFIEIVVALTFSFIFILILVWQKA